MTRDQLLEASLEFVAREGLTDFSLRSCAAAIGTSHRMLGYYFGSKEGLVVEIANAAAARFRDLLEHYMEGRDFTTAPLSGEEIDGILDGFYRRTDLPGLLPLLAEVAFRIARHPGANHGDATRYADLIDLWRPAVTRQLQLQALPERQAAARLRLAIAVMIGTSVDYLGTHDREALIASQREWLRLTLGV